MKSMTPIPLKPYAPYRPSNGDEGCCFYEDWCENCARDATMNSGKNYDDCSPEEICEIIGATLRYKIDDPKYPQEWVYGATGPMCSAFVPVGELVPPRCKLTRDMFGDGK